jgi:hypothetical protein
MPVAMQRRYGDEGPLTARAAGFATATRASGWQA